MVLAARHNQAGGLWPRQAGFVVQAGDRDVRVSCRNYDVPPGVRAGQVLAQVHREYAGTLEAAGYLTIPWKRGRKQVGLIITGRTQP